MGRMLTVVCLSLYKGIRTVAVEDELKAWCVTELEGSVDGNVFSAWVSGVRGR